MKIREKTTIDAEPSVVWPFVADPVGQAVWNPKLIAVDCESRPVVLGQKFQAIYRMRGRDNQSDVEVTDCQAPLRVTFRHRQQGTPGFTDEGYELTQLLNGQTRLVQVIDFGNTSIPWFFQAIIWFISRFGWDAEEPYLDRLKRIVESEAA